MREEKKKYITPELEILNFNNDDIITKSFNPNDEDGEDW